MIIADMQFKKYSFTFDEPMRVAFGFIERFDTLILKMETDDGLVGYGEAAPLGFVTGDSVETAFAVGKEIRSELIGQSPLALDSIHSSMDAKYAHNMAIKASVDIACHDIAAKRMGVPLYQYLGGSCAELVSDVTVGIDTPEAMAEKSVQWVERGWKSLKIKLGQDIALDLERMRAIRQVVGNRIALRIDANQGWTVKDSIRIINELEALEVELIEQPVAHWDQEGLATITSAVNLPVVADESCHVPTDAARLAARREVDGINIKLMKCGGIRKAQEIDAIAKANNMFCMIGCMGESRVANVAAMHFAAAHPNVKVIDLDTSFYSHNDLIQGGYSNVGEVCCLTDEPGIGVTVEGF